jgi:RNA polymerase sigma factor (sigma-70 family)
MKSSLIFLNTDAKILDLIRRGDEEGLVMLYESNRRSIVAYVSQNSGTPDDAEDLLQESLVVLWERVRSGQFEYRARLCTFIYGVAKNMWSRRLARMRREAPSEPDPEEHSDGALSPLDDLIECEESELVRRALERIGEQCKKLLNLFYWEELSMEEIAVQMGFANADTVKAKKYQCKKALETVLREVLERRGS